MRTQIEIVLICSCNNIDKKKKGTRQDLNEFFSIALDVFVVLYHSGTQLLFIKIVF